MTDKRRGLTTLARTTWRANRWFRPAGWSRRPTASPLGSAVASDDRHGRAQSPYTASAVSSTLAIACFSAKPPSRGRRKITLMSRATKATQATASKAVEMPESP